MKGQQKHLTYEDLNEVLLSVYSDLKEEVMSGRHDSGSTDAMTVSMVTLAFMGVRLNERLQKSDKATREFDFYLNKVKNDVQKR